MIFHKKTKFSISRRLARSLEYKNKGQTWIFTLREAVYWTDGVPFHAQHVVDAMGKTVESGNGQCLCLLFVSH